MNNEQRVEGVRVGDVEREIEMVKTCTLYGVVRGSTARLMGLGKEPIVLGFHSDGSVDYKPANKGGRWRSLNADKKDLKLIEAALREASPAPPKHITDHLCFKGGGFVRRNWLNIHKQWRDKGGANTPVFSVGPDGPVTLGDIACEALSEFMGDGVPIKK